MDRTEIMGKNEHFFSQQPFWEVTRKRENSLLQMEEFPFRVIRLDMNEGCHSLDCIPGVGQLGIIFSVQQKEASAYVYGVLPEKKRIPMYDIEHALLVQFVPGGFKWLTGIPADGIPAEGLDIGTVFPWAGPFVEHINAVDSGEEHSLLVRSFLAKCHDSKNGKQETEEKMAASIADFMMAERRAVRMKELEEYYGYSARTLQKLVLKNVGITPKQLNLQICLQNAISLMRQRGTCSLTEMSHQMYFYAQSHFNRLFSKMTGLCPGEYLKRLDLGRTEEFANMEESGRTGSV